MKPLIEKIMFKFGYVPIKYVKIAEIKTNNKWKKIILDEKDLLFEQLIATTFIIDIAMNLSGLEGKVNGESIKNDENT